MNVLSLFDGMSCGRIALENAGIHVDSYYASEINKPAINAVMTNYPGTQMLGDIAEWEVWDIDWGNIDLVLAGSPCQGFSSIGNQGKFEHEGSKLFFVFADILSHIQRANPDVNFLLENVRMDAQSENTISRIVGFAPVMIDSSIHSTCSRPRNYWSNFQINQPCHRNISFSDVVDFSIDETNLSDGWFSWWEKAKENQLKKGYSKIVAPGEKGICLLARQYACWAGNFIPTPSGSLRKPTKEELAKIVGAPGDYFRNSTQRQAEEMTGNGWDVRTITHIFECMKEGKPNTEKFQLDIFGMAA